jgi:cytochrome c peroxidase
MTQLRALTLPPEGPPLDASNAHGDALLAQRLGKRLFFEAGYSGQLGPYNVAKNTNGALGGPTDKEKVSCQSCHDPMTAGADQRSLPRATSLGAGYTVRNAPTVINAAYSPLWQFWDGRADSLWSQALLPPEGAAESAGTRLKVVHVLYKNYRQDYEDVFGAGSLPDYLADTVRFPDPGTAGDGDVSDADKPILNGIYANFGKAIAAYERRLVSNAFQPSPFDAFMAGDTQAMSPAAIRGARLFVGRAGCTECHSGPTFTDFAFHNVGAPQAGEYVPATDLGRFGGIDAIEARMEDPQFDFTRRSLFSDQVDEAHLTALTQSGADDATKKRTQGQFKTPTLRNVGKTAPYMHDGAYQTLWDVVNHYNFGGGTGPYAGVKDPAIAPLLLTDAELGDLVEFLRALDDGDALETHDFDQVDGDTQGLLGRPAF